MLHTQLEKKATPSLADNGGVTPMMLAAEGGHEVSSKVLEITESLK